MVSSNNDNGKMAAAARSPEVIDLLADLDNSPSPAGFSTMNNSMTKMRSGKKRRLRPARSAGIINLNDGDNDIVEIIEPSSRTNYSSVAAASSASASTYTAAASMKQPQQQSTSNNNMNLVERIREVFPLVSRAKVETFLSMAKSYSTDESNNDNDENVFLTVMTVLSEDPLGTSISDATFAAAAVGGRLEGGNSTSSGGNDMSVGRRKVAQLECQCCYVEYDFELMVSCRTGGHLFCKTCLQKHTEQRVFGIGNFGVKNDNNINGGKNSNNAKHNASSTKALEILCMASDCTSGFNEIQLRKALSEKVLKKYNELQYAAVIESANMGDISKCSKCDFMAVADEKWPPNLFHCPQCNFKSCKECGEEYHPEIRCDQVESKKETSGRTTVEEAMTQALVRTCPRPMCRKKFMKSDGCNKMTCSCGCFVCYVCRKEIPAAVAYKHFCQTPHCKHKTCNLCPLYADTSEADKARVTNAAKKAARSVRKNVKVDVNAMLKDPPPAPFGRKR